MSTRLFIYGTFQPGLRHHAVLERFGATVVQEAVLERGFRMSVRYRGNGDNAFDRQRNSHFVEPVLTRDRVAKDRVVGTVVDVDMNDDLIVQFSRVIGQTKGYPIVSAKTECGLEVGVHICTSLGDLRYKSDPGLYRYEDGRIRYSDASPLVFEPTGHRFHKELHRTAVGPVEGGRLLMISVFDIFRYDIHADSMMRRIARDFLHPVEQRQVPVFAFVPRE